jgi:hypothetical protein
MLLSQRAHYRRQSHYRLDSSFETTGKTSKSEYSTVQQSENTTATCQGERQSVSPWKGWCNGSFGNTGSFPFHGQHLAHSRFRACGIDSPEPGDSGKLRPREAVATPLPLVVQLVAILVESLSVCFTSSVVQRPDHDQAAVGEGGYRWDHPITKVWFGLQSVHLNFLMDGAIL